MDHTESSKLREFAVKLFNENDREARWKLWEQTDALITDIERNDKQNEEVHRIQLSDIIKRFRALHESLVRILQNSRDASP